MQGCGCKKSLIDPHQEDMTDTTEIKKGDWKVWLENKPFFKKCQQISESKITKRVIIHSPFQVNSYIEIFCS